MSTNKNLKGFTLIEGLISILVVSFLIFIFANTSYYIKIASQLKNTILAYNLAQEEIESLRYYYYDLLPNLTEGDFINVVYNQGKWQVKNDGSSNVYELLSFSGSGLNGLALLPFGDMSDYTLETDIKIDTDSPSGWSSGLFFRIKDSNNFYQLKFNNNLLYITKKLNGAESELFSTPLLTSTDSWNTYKLVVSGNNFEIYRNTSLIGTTTDPEDSFSEGKIALLGYDGVHSYFDQVKIDGSLVENGDFEAGTIGETAEGWQWLSLYELPQAQGKLTISDYQGNSNIKNITVKVEWYDGYKTKSVELETLISKYGMHL